MGEAPRLPGSFLQEGGHFLKRLILLAVVAVGLSSPAAAMKPARAWLGYASPDSTLFVYAPNEIKIGAHVARLSDEIIQSAGLRAAEEAGLPAGASVMFCFNWTPADTLQAGATIEPDSLELVLAGRPVRAALLLQGEPWTVIHPMQRTCIFAFFPSVTLTDKRITGAVVHWNGHNLPLAIRAALR